MAKQTEAWKTKVLLLGGVVGALTGLGAAYLLIQQAEAQQKPPRLTAGKGVKLGMLLLGLLRQVGQLLDE